MRTWRIASLGATEVRVHPVLSLYLAYAWLTGHGLFALLAFGSILLHELAHAACAAAFGQAPHCIEITPLGAVMRLEDENRLTITNDGSYSFNNRLTYAPDIGSISVNKVS